MPVRAKRTRASASNSLKRSRSAKKPVQQPQPTGRLFPAWGLLIVVAVLTLPRWFAEGAQSTASLVFSVPGAVIDVGGDAVETSADVSAVLVGAAFDLGKIAAKALLEAGAVVVRAAGDIVGRLFSGKPAGVIAPLFTDEVDYWSASIERWAAQYNLDPNLLATVMQIESCGHPTISSSAGAQGLFQVMPFHFASDENQLDPDTNARRGAGVLNECLRLADNDPGLAMACYNGGPSVLYRAFSVWHPETQRYYRWGSGTYADAQQNLSVSQTLNAWLDAGGAVLCDMAADVQMAD